jgi:short-subunit dehydrogenase
VRDRAIDLRPGARRALVTGASSGIGAAFAAAFAERGCDLVLVARNHSRLDELAQHLRREYAVTVEVLAADLTDAEQRRAIETRLARDPAVDILVNDAGVASVGRFASLAADQQAAQIALNVVAVVRLTRAVLPGMLARRRGTIINVSSIAAFVPARFSATYGATKAYLNSFSEALYEELRGSGVHVQVLCPGFTRTEFAARAGADAGAIPAFAWMTPEAVVTASLSALRRRRSVCVPGWRNRLLTTVLAGLPRRLACRVAGAGAKQGWAADALRRGGN